MTLCRRCGGPHDIVNDGGIITYSRLVGDVCQGCHRIWDYVWDRWELDGPVEGWREPTAVERLRESIEKAGHNDGE